MGFTKSHVLILILVFSQILRKKGSIDCLQYKRSVLAGRGERRKRTLSTDGQNATLSSVTNLRAFFLINCKKKPGRKRLHGMQIFRKSQYRLSRCLLIDIYTFFGHALSNA